MTTRTIGAEVCVIGGGLTGMMTAQAALAAGRSVVVIERGGEYRPDPVDRRTWWKESVADLGPTERDFRHYRNDFDEADDHFDDLVEVESNRVPFAFRYNMRYGIGGSAEVWSGLAWRLIPSDFRTASTYGYGVDWPISYDDLAPHYARAERYLEVSGPNASHRAGYRYWPWDNAFAYDHFPLTYLDHEVQRSLGAMGELVPQPHAVRNRPVDEGGCVGAKTCVSFCEAKAIFSATDRILPHIVSDARLEFLTDTAVVRLGWGAVGGIDYAECREADHDETFKVEADTFFLCGNGFENIRLIKTSEQRNGCRLGPSSRWVGSHFSTHGAVVYTVMMSDPVFPVRGRPTHASVIEWLERGRREKVGGIALEIWNSDFTLGYTPWMHLERHVEKGHWGGHLFNLLDTFERRFCASFIYETEMTADKRVTISPTLQDRFGIPLGRATLAQSKFDRRTIAKAERLAAEFGAAEGVASVVENGRGMNGNHPLGGLRMSRGPGSGVVDDRLRAHDRANLYVLGGGAFCSTGGLNPTLTITALAMRAFDDPRLGWVRGA